MTGNVTYTSFILHFIGFLWYCFGIYHDRNSYVLIIYDGYGGRFQFVTLITVYITWFATAFATVTDLIQIRRNGYSRNISKFINIRDELMTSLVFTLCAFCCILFWMYYFIDPALFNPELAKVIPVTGWFNQFLHTVPFFYAVILTINVNYQYSTVVRSSFILMVAAIGLRTWVRHCGSVNGYFGYPMLETLSPNLWYLFFTLCFIALFTINHSGRKMASLVWNKKKMEHTMKTKQH